MKFDNIISQELPKYVLSSLIRKPENSPRMMIISGPYGTGRKTLIKEYLKSLKCESKERLISNCGKCEICNNILKDREFFREYDCSEIEKIEYSKYIMITNFERCSREKQNELYNWFNENSGVTLILITESTDNIIDNIMALSLILRTNLITYEDTLKYLLDRVKDKDINISKETLEIISRRSRGHLLEAIKMVSKYYILDEETFNQSIMSAREYYICFLISCYIDNKEYVDKYITLLKNIPLAYLKIDYEALIVEIMKTVTKFEKPRDKYMEVLIDKIKTKALELYYILNDKIIYNSFQNDDTFQAAMYVIYLKLNNRIR